MLAPLGQLSLKCKHPASQDYRVLDAKHLGDGSVDLWNGCHGRDGLLAAAAGTETTGKEIMLVPLRANQILAGRMADRDSLSM